MALANYKRRLLIPVPEYASEQTNLQYRVTVPFLFGMETDFSDIQFTDSDGETLLSQKRELYTPGVSATWWISVPNNPIPGKTAYLYYYYIGTPTLNSDGDATFPVYLDVNNYNDPAKFTITITLNGSVTAEAGYVKMQRITGTVKIEAVHVFTFPKHFWMKWVVWPDTDSGRYYIGGGGCYFCKRSGMSVNYYWDHSQDPMIESNYVLFTQQWGTVEYDIVTAGLGGPLTTKGYINGNLDFTIGGGTVSSDSVVFTYLMTSPGILYIRYAFGFNLPTTDELDKFDITPLWENPEILIPDLACAFSGAPVEGERELSVNFTDQSTGAVRWHWEFGDGEESYDQSPAHTYRYIAAYTVRLTVWDENDFSLYEEKSNYVTVTMQEVSQIGELVNDIGFRIRDPKLE